MCGSTSAERRPHPGRGIRLACALALASGMAPGCQWNVGSVDIRLVHTARDGMNPLDPAVIDRLRVRIDGDSFDPRQTELELDGSGGGFTDIPAGGRVRITVEGLAGSGIVRARGASAPFEARAEDQTLFLYISLVGECSGPPVATAASAPGFAERFRTDMRTGAGRAFHDAVELPGGLVLLAGGVGGGADDDPLARRGSGNVVRSAERFDPTAAAWLLDDGASGPDCEPGEPLCLQAGRAFLSLSRLPGLDTVLVAGGEPVDADRSFETFEPDALRFFSPGGASLARPRSRAGRVALAFPSRALLLAGGVDAAGQILDSVELFDAESGSGTFSEAGRLSEARVAPAVVQTSMGVLVVGGFRRFEEWPQVGTPLREASGRIDRITFGGGGLVVESLGELRAPRAEASATLITPEDDTSRALVLVCGGLADAVNTLASCEVIDARTGDSQEGGAVFDLRWPRYRHTATLLPDGRVLVAGGFQRGGSASALNHAVLLDSVNGYLPDELTMVARRAGHTATLLPSGLLLLAGGQGASGQPASVDYELFNP